jgi:hypothetical protein
VDFASATATAPAHLLIGTVLTGLGLLGTYVFACWFWPYARCGRCGGTGRRQSPSGKAFRLCRRCQGSARRLRIGRRVFNYFRILQKEGTK